MGLNAAIGKYILFLDSDDYIIGSKLQSLLNILRDSYDNCFSIGFTTSDKIITYENSDLSITSLNLKSYLRKVKNPVTNAWKLVTRRKYLIDNEIIFQEGVLVEDIKWISEVIIPNKKIMVIPETIYVYETKRDESIMSTPSSKRLQDCDINILTTLKSLKDQKKRIKRKYHFLLFKEWCYNLSFYSELNPGDQLKINISKEILLRNNNLLILFTRIIIALIGIHNFAKLMKFIRIFRKKIYKSLKK